MPGLQLQDADLDGQGFSRFKNTLDGTGIYLPSDWGKIWFPKRNAAPTSKAVVHCVGSSITTGYFASDLKTKGWVGLLRTLLQNAYGDGGSGYHPAADTANVLNALSTSAATPYAAQLWTLTGGNWSTANTVDSFAAGPFGGYINSTNVQGAVVTIPNVRGTTLTLYFSSISSAFTASQFTVKVNGVSVGTTTIPNGVAGAAGWAVYKQSFAHGVTGSYTVELDALGGAGSYATIFGVSGENANGVVVNRMGLPNTPSTLYAQPNPANHSTYDVADYGGGQFWPCDLLIFDMSGGNDLGNDVDPDFWIDNVRFFLERVRNNPSTDFGATDIILFFHHLGDWENHPSGSPPGAGHQYFSRARALAEAYGAAVYDCWGMFRNSYGYAASLNFWGTGTDASGNPGTDLVHPGDAGHSLIVNGDATHRGLKDLVLAS